MPRARRRRRPPGRGLGQSVLIGIALTITVVLVAGSLLAIHTQSKGYRDATTVGYVALADPIGQASARTGAQLSALMAAAPSLTNGQFPNTARGELEQGLDAAVLATTNQATQAATISSPPPVGGMSGRFTQVMQLRASTTEAVRATIDQLLGMSPLPVAGAPTTAAPAPAATFISTARASAELSAEGQQFVAADNGFRAVRAEAAAQHLASSLRASVWVHPPIDSAPLGPTALGATAAALALSPALRAFHHLVITAVGLSPPAVPSGGVGIVATSCIAPQSTAPGATPTVVPPTSTLQALVSVTNCGTVPEADVTVTVTVAPADDPGSTAIPSAGQGGRSRAVVTIASGASSAPSLAPLPVAPGHRYTLTVTVSLPPAQADAAGATQQFLIQVTA